jgi:glycosyltransferase involved in cell wall biosynthesis
MNVDVIIPCFNVEDFIEECLDSVKLQGKCVRKVFCVDNNSTDNTVKTIQKWSTQNPDIDLLLLHEKKPGASSARNKPLSLVETEWIQFLDADDLLLGGKISVQLDHTKDCDVIYDSCLKKSTFGKIRKIKTEKNVELGLMKGALGNTCANLWRKSTLKDVEGWNEKLASSQESDLLIRIHGIGGRFKRLDSSKTLIREREFGQISQGNKKLLWENYTNLRVNFYHESIKPLKDNALENSALLCIFGAIQILHQYNPSLALQIHNTILKSSNFRPATKTIRSKLYLFIYQVFGFQSAERIRMLLKKP